jgi:sulfate transport system ATP-binding protein
MSVIVEKLSKRFTAGGTPAVSDVSFHAPSGAITTLLGPSGAGKSTLLRLIAGLETPDTGSVRIEGVDCTHLPVQKRGIGVVFQSYALFRHMTVRENIAFGLVERRVPRPEVEARVDEMLRLVQLEELGRRLPGQLSGGQRQRVAFARALAIRPKLLLLDEPFGALDSRVRVELREWLQSLHEQTGVTTLLVTHDQEEALALADRVALMRDGAIVQVDAPERLYHEPRDRWSAAFVGAANFIAPARAAALGCRPCPEPGDVLVRPELVLLAPDGAGDGEVVAREFRGHDVLYRVELRDGTALWSQRPSNEVVPLGARVRVSVGDGPVTALS